MWWEAAGLEGLSVSTAHTPIFHMCPVPTVSQHSLPGSPLPAVKR